MSTAHVPDDAALPRVSAVVPQQGIAERIDTLRPASLS
jgi:hypothetical protein